MRPKILNRSLETDDGIFNIQWWLDFTKYPRDFLKCEHKTLGPAGARCSSPGRYWCQECGFVCCKKHRVAHADSRLHATRVAKWKEEAKKNSSTKTASSA